MFDRKMCHHTVRPLEITRLVQQLQPALAHKFRDVLMTELGCNSEGQFLAKVVNLMYQSNQLTQQSYDNLRDKALLCAEQQRVPDTDGTLLKYVTNKHVKYSADCLSIANQDVINHIGSYLDADTCHKLGYINMQLYIHTHTSSFLVATSPNTHLHISKHRLNRLMCSHSNPFHYSMPNSLYLDGDFLTTHEEIIKSSWFTNLFSHVTSLKCGSIEWMTTIPFEVVLRKHKRNDARIDKLHLYLMGSSQKITQYDNIIHQQVQQITNANMPSSRTIRRLELWFNTSSWVITQLLSGFSGLHEELIIVGPVKVSSYAQLCHLFHPRLKYLCFKGTDTIDFDIRDVPAGTCPVANVRHLSLKMSPKKVQPLHNVRYVLQSFSLASQLIIFEVDLMLHTQAPLRPCEQRAISDILTGFPRDHYPLLEKVVFTIADTMSLLCFQKVLKCCKLVKPAHEIEIHLRNIRQLSPQRLTKLRTSWDKMTTTPWNNEQRIINLTKSQCKKARIRELISKMQLWLNSSDSPNGSRIRLEWTQQL